jgi:hypothetical protein
VFTVEIAEHNGLVNTLIARVVCTPRGSSAMASLHRREWPSFSGLTSDLAHLEKRPIQASKPVPPVRGRRRVKGKSPVPLEKLSISAQTDFEWKKSRFL